jgi:hypothetical protein
LGQNDSFGNPVAGRSVDFASNPKIVASKIAVFVWDTTVSAKVPGPKFIRSFKMKKIHKHILTVLALVCGVIFAACGNPTGDNGNNNGNGDNNGNGNNGTTENINFGDITATSTQEEVTNTIKLSLELLQSQTQNIINKLTEHKTGLQTQLSGLTPGSTRYDEIMLQINAVASMIISEQRIAGAQQSRYTEQGLNDMYSSYTGLITGVNNLQNNPIDKSLLSKKMDLYQIAVSTDERNIITSTKKASAFNNMRKIIASIKDLEAQKGNENYYLPDPETNMPNLKWTLQSEIKQKLNSLLGQQHGQYIFYQGEDIAEYGAVWDDANALGKETNLPRSVAQYSIQYPAEVNAQAEAEVVRQQ